MAQRILSFGDLVGERYRITDVLGQGGMATVFQAHQAGLERPVAVKVMHHYLSSQGGFLQRFRLEAQNLATLRHPHIVQVHDFAVEDELCYMVMEYLPGETVAARLAQLSQEQQLMAIADVIQIGVELGEALSYAHQRGLIHRDIKPANVIFGEQGQAILTDFGIAKLMTHDLQLTATQAMVGTPNYMAPEFGLGQRGDPRADIYSLGVLLYQLVTGRLPFIGTTPLAVIHQHIEKPPPPPSELRADIPAGLEKTILRALAKLPAERYQTAAEMVGQLRHLDQAAAQPIPASLRQSPTRLNQGDSDTMLLEEAIVPPPNNLPVQLTSFIGRTDEVAAVSELLGAPGTRLVTITGPGGVGKTRLSQQVASQLLFAFPAGVHFVPLEALHEPDQVLEAIASTLGVRAEGQLIKALSAHLAGQELLLLLDNFEQVLPAAPALAELLNSAPTLKLLITSRESLHIYGEQEFPLPPLATAADSAAIQLFAERARAVQPGFRLDETNTPIVAQICARLDGLPLAIELAAARIKMLSPAAILQRLGQGSLQLLSGRSQTLPSRQQTLRGAIAWSYNLLTEQEQLLLNRLAIFVGSRPLEAILPVINPDEQLSLDLLDGLSSLVDKSLLSQQEGPDGEPNFLMLRTIHAYAREQLATSADEALIRRQHARFYLALAEEGGAALQGPEQGQWLARLAWAHDNLRAALDWATDAGEAELVARFGQALWRFWDARGHHREGRRWLEWLVGPAGSLDPTATPASLAQARALVVAGHLAYRQSDFAVARTYYEAGRAQLEQLDADLDVGLVLHNLGLLHHKQGDLHQARSVYASSLARLRASGAEAGVANVLNSLGNLAWMQGDLASARDYYRQSSEHYRRLGNKQNEAMVFNNLGAIAMSEEDYPTAAEIFQRCLTIHEELDNKNGTSLALSNLAEVALEQGDLGAAQRYLAEALAQKQALGHREGVAILLETAGRLALGKAQFNRCATLFGAAEELRAQLAAPRPDVVQRLCESAWNQARARLGAEPFAVAWATGRTLSEPEMIALALGDGSQR
ncbi:MAG: protein kinase [Anaerolineales bacterium]|nr:protein kinase [Anaerolineales bacterium]